MRAARWTRITVALTVLPALGACNQTSESPAIRSPGARVGPSLPAAVERKKDAIARAARSFDYTLLGELLDPEAFSYSFGERGDPIAYWRRLEEEAHMPVVGEILPSVLATTPGQSGDTYVWPAAFAKNPDDWSPRDIADLRTFNNKEDIERFRSFGGYSGWRVGIRADGTWLFFIAGD